ncbi:hypothetical protein J2Z83_003725 [Virgibacillus natechei]|uniref:Uncharacterized protein n=1 Tax=Virgibacillus natechei TaxID=1216297 RepID=A0ABS4INI9_9BACI|nr:hypothetical protein [Virgibacillus natechei]
MLDQNENEILELDNVEGGSVEMASLSDLKRSAKFSMKEPEGYDIDYNSDRIQVFVEFKMPTEYEQNIVDDDEWYFISPGFYTDQTRKMVMTKKEGGWVSFSLGIFLLSSPTQVEEGKSVYRDIEAYDKLLILQEDKVTDRYTISAGTSYYDAMVDILESAGADKINIENDDKVINNDKEWDPGTEKLRILNDLVSDLNFTQLWVDEYGYFRTSGYQSPQNAPTDYIYEDDELSVTLEGMEEELDLFDLPNVFNVVVANPDTEEEFTSIVENTNPNHPRSIPRLGRRVVRFEEKDDIADQDSLDGHVERLASNASQIYGKVKFDTAIMPFHSYSNVIRVRNSVLGIDHKFAETSWSIDLEAGSDMSHEMRRVVSLV